MNEEQEELFGQYIAEFALEYDLKLNDDDIMKAIELFDECTDRWSSDSDASIYEIANDLGLKEDDEDIVEMISVVWKKIHTN
jgi:cell division protein FtsL